MNSMNCVILAVKYSKQYSSFRLSLNALNAIETWIWPLSVKNKFGYLEPNLYSQTKYQLQLWSFPRDSFLYMREQGFNE